MPAFGISIHQDGYVALLVAADEHILDGLYRFRCRLFFKFCFVLFFQKFVAHIARGFFVLCRHILMNVGVKLVVQSQLRGKIFKHIVVEFHDVLVAAPVDVLTLAVALLITAETLFHLIAEKVWVGVAEAIDALLDVADYQVVVPCRQAVL